jgi:hypothetical protein
MNLCLHYKCHYPADNTFETSDKTTPEHRCYFTIFINIYVLFTSCEQGCLLLHPKKIQVFCVGVDDLYNNKWKGKQTTCMQ